MRLAALVVSALLLVDVAHAGPAQAHAPSGDVVLRWSHALGGAGDVDRGPTVEVFEDGAVLVDYPGYMKRAGVWTMRLSRRELDELVDRVVGAGVMEFDENAARARCRAAEAAGRHRTTAEMPEMFEVFDAATTRIEVELGSRRAVRRRRVGGVPSTSTSKSLSWYALAATADRYPDLSEIQDLARVEQAMKALLRRPELERVETEAR